MRVRCVLREIRGRRSVRELETLSGINRGTLSQIERGRLLPLDEHIPALERAYGKPAHTWYPDHVLLQLQHDDEGGDE